MVKIRKKTSNRTSTRMRAKVKHKVAESHRKQKKHAKNDPTWRSNKPKELGIPNSFPFKDQLLAEAQAEKARVEEEKAQRREAAKAANQQGATLASTAALAAALAADAQAREDAMFDDEEGGLDAEERQVQDASLKLHAKSLRKVLEMSDVVIEVLDARDPVGTRCRAVERELKSLDGGRKKLVLVLNKIDLVPPQVVQAWLAHLRLQAPTIPFKSSTQQQRNHLSASSAATPQSASGSSTKPLMELIKGFRLHQAQTGSSGEASTSSGAPVKHSLTIGLIGHPNVGKSSLINTLKRSKACSVAPTPGWTKEVQEVVIEKGVRVLDCPGVVVEMRGEVEGALKGMIKPEDVRDAKAPVEAILSRCSPTHLQMLYSIPHFVDTTGFLLGVARAKGRLRKGGVPDLDGTARSILRDWVAGRIAYYTAPPTAAQTEAMKAATAAEQQQVGTVSEADVGGASLHTQFAPAFDLKALFGEADAVAFEKDGAGSAVGERKAVKMKEGALGVEADDADVGWVVGDEPDEAAMEEDDDDLNLDDLVDDEEDEDDDDEMEEDEEVPTLVPAASGIKGKRAAPSSAPSEPAANRIVSVAPPAKKKKQMKSVSFSSTPLGPTGSTVAAAAPSAAAVNKAQFEAEGGDVALNKKAKQKAKKDKKRAAKQTAKLNEEVRDATREFGADAELPSKPRPARTVKGSVGEVYDYAEFFPTSSKQKKPTAGDDGDVDM